MRIFYHTSSWDPQIATGIINIYQPLMKWFKLTGFDYSHNSAGLRNLSSSNWEIIPGPSPQLLSVSQRGIGPQSQSLTGHKEKDY